MVASLQTVHQHGAIGFAQNVLSDLDHQVRANTQDVAVKGAMMEFVLGVRRCVRRL